MFIVRLLEVRHFPPFCQTDVAAGAPSQVLRRNFGLEPDQDHSIGALLKSCRNSAGVDA